MKIGIDASRAVNEKAGIGRLTSKMIENFLSNQDNQYRLFFNFVSDFKEKSQAANRFKRSNSEIIITKIPGKIKEKLLGSRIGFYRGKMQSCEVFFASTFLDVDFSLKIPQVVAIHDMTMFRFPEHLGLSSSHFQQKRTQLACQKAKKITTISKATKKDIIELLGVPSEKIEVIYPGLNQFEKIAPSLPKSYQLKPKNYILFTGTIEPRKNLTNLLKAYGLLPKTLQDKYPLVIVGAQGWNTGEIYQTLEREKLKDRVKFLGFQSDEILAKLYQEAAVFIYPSLYEGFGFPIIEAMQFGTPVVTSNRSSMPEAAGSAAVLINPDDPKSITDALQAVLKGKISRSQLSKAGIAQARKFSWEKYAEQMLKVFKNATLK